MTDLQAELQAGQTQVLDLEAEVTDLQAELQADRKWVTCRHTGSKRSAGRLEVRTLYRKEARLRQKRKGYLGRKEPGEEYSRQ